MNTDQLLIAIDDHIQEVNDQKDERLTRLETIKTYIDFNIRLTKLSEAEQRDFSYCMTSFPLTTEQRTLINSCTQERKDYYFEMWARATYMKRCAWLQYLHGQTEDKPFVGKTETA